HLVRDLVTEVERGGVVPLEVHADVLAAVGLLLRRGAQAREGAGDTLGVRVVGAAGEGQVVTAEVVLQGPGPGPGDARVAGYVRREVGREAGAVGTRLQGLPGRVGDDARVGGLVGAGDRVHRAPHVPVGVVLGVPDGDGRVGERRGRQTEEP